MNFITLNDGVLVPQLGLGVYKALEGGEVENAVSCALACGYRHIDTAAYYQNERGVGKAIKASALLRSELFITTKVWTDEIRSRSCRASFMDSLEKLDCGYISTRWKSAWRRKTRRSRSFGWKRRWRFAASA